MEIDKLVLRMAQKKRGPQKFTFFKTDSNLKLTGYEVVISGETPYETLVDFAAEIGGTVSRTKKHIKMPDGTFWFLKILG